MTAWTHTVGPSCPWPERRGLRCRIVDPPSGRPVYPWAARLPHERVVLIDGDPFGPYSRHDPSWSCVLYADDLIPIGEDPS